ncbi:MAG: SH3 domain-containing protein [Hyphomicrobiales bacterium]|nr:SH3 domain-containing protein [Rickettsiales bacterium]MCP5361188.1 SH3 domain-containing protein [Hyphomicrobiales bacterium]
MKKMILLVVIASLWMGVIRPVTANDTLPLPRFAALKSNEANMRTGPGLRYQVKWVLVKQNMPLEIVAEFEQWRKVRDHQGDEGWIHRSMISGKRTVMITGGERILYQDMDSNAYPVAKLEDGVLAQVMECRTDRCHVRVGGFKGWVDRQGLWGIYPGELIQ